MEKRYVMGLDVGTSSVKACIFDAEGRQAGHSYAESQVICQMPKQAEQDSVQVMAAMKRVMHGAIGQSGIRRLEAVSYSVQGDAVIPVNERFQPIHNAVLGMDYRSEKQCEALKRRIDVPGLFALTGQPLHPINAALKVLWFRVERPEIYEKAYKFVTYSELVSHYLGGRPAMDHTMATRTMAVDLDTLDWSQQALDAIGLPGSVWCPVAKSGEVLGEMKESLAGELGLLNRPMIVAGAHDQTAGAVGAGVIYDGMAVESSGTAEIFCVTYLEKNTSRTMMDSYYQCYRHALSDRFFTFAHTQIGGILLRWFRDNFAYQDVAAAREKGEDPYDYLFERIDPGPGKVFVLPHFNGSGTPTCDMDSMGAIVGLTLATTRYEIFQGIAEGLAYELRINMEAMERAGLSIDSIRVVGGGAKSPLWLQKKADITGRELTTLRCGEAACLGAAILAAAGAGIFGSVEEGVGAMVKTGKTYKPNAREAAEYERHYHVYSGLYGALINSNREINML